MVRPPDRNRYRPGQKPESGRDIDKYFNKLSFHIVNSPPVYMDLGRKSSLISAFQQFQGLGKVLDDVAGGHSEGADGFLRHVSGETMDKGTANGGVVSADTGCH